MSSIALTDQTTAASTYDAAAGNFDAAPVEFWRRHGQRTVDLLDLQPADTVLDVGCGTGTSALPAAAAVGPFGTVTGIDISEAMLHEAQAKAAAQGLKNVTFKKADMSSTGFADAGFDAVISVFSLFFVKDMERQIAELWRLLHPGGKLAVTVWGPKAFQPGAAILREEFARLRPNVCEPERPWQRLTQPHQVRSIINDVTGYQPLVRFEPDYQPTLTSDDWWAIFVGSGFRWYTEQLTPDEQSQVRTRLAEWFESNSEAAGQMDTSVVIAITTKS